MNPRRLLLVECIDAAGASPRDVRVHARMLQTAGHAVRCVVVAPHDDALAFHAPPPTADVTLLPSGSAGHAALAALAGEGGIDATIVASAAAGGGAAGAALQGIAPAGAYWWPTGIGAHGRSGAGPLEPLAFHADDHGIEAEPWPLACAGLRASVCEDARLTRSQLPLWDGDYVVSPLPLAGDAGRVALDAFARISADRDGLDFVVLADPQPEFEAIARALGIGFRVHFAGAAPRDAELAWLGAAGAALVAGDGPLSGGLVLRALERGCPVVAAPGGALAAPLDAWLDANGARPGVPGEALPARLERVLARAGGVEDAIAAGRAVAARARIERLAPRIAAALGGAAARRRAA